MTDRHVAATLVATLVTGLALVAVAPGAATGHLSLSCADGDTGAEFLADGGLAVSDDVDAAVTVNPVVNDTALAFDNVTVLANGTARVVLEAATADTVCTGAVDATGTPVALAPDAFGSATVDGSLEALAYGPVDYASGTTDLAYNASAPVTVTLGEAPDPGTQVRAVDADTNRTLANATVASDGTVALSLPADGHAVDLRTAEGDPAVPPGAVYGPDSPAAAYDGTDGDRDGRIDISELGTAASDYTTDELTLAELGDVAAAYVRS